MHDYGRGGLGGFEAARRFDSAEAGQAEIHQHDVGRAGACGLDRGAPLADRGNDCEIGRERGQHAPPLAEQRPIVHPQPPQFFSSGNLHAQRPAALGAIRGLHRSPAQGEALARAGEAATARRRRATASIVGHGKAHATAGIANRAAAPPLAHARAPGPRAKSAAVNRPPARRGARDGRSHPRQDPERRRATEAAQRNDRSEQGRLRGKLGDEPPATRGALLIQRAKHASNASARPTAVRPPPRGGKKRHGRHGDGERDVAAEGNPLGLRPVIAEPWAGEWPLATAPTLGPPRRVWDRGRPRSGPPVVKGASAAKERRRSGTERKFRPALRPEGPPRRQVRAVRSGTVSAGGRNETARSHKATGPERRCAQSRAEGRG